jgi:transcriptional regulator with GAF, ATPase, and Fis domain
MSLSPDGRERNPAILFHALTRALETLTTSDDPVAALRESFHLAQDGLGAQKGLLLYVRSQTPLELEIVEARGLEWEQQEACRQMQSTPAEGVSPSVIREAIERHKPVFIPNAADASERWRTTSLTGGAHSVLCAPVIGAAGVIAVIYFQSQGILQSFESDDLHWLTAYATALGQGLNLHQARRTPEPIAPRIVGVSTWTQKLIRSLDTLVPTLGKAPPLILLLGEPGTGRKLSARYLHYYSARHTGPFRVVSAKALTPEDLATSIRASRAGVLVVDELAELSAPALALLLQVLELCELPAAADGRPVGVDVQVIATSTQAPSFLADGATTIRMLPVRVAERRADVAPLVEHFLAEAETEQHKRLGGVSGAALAALSAYAWPLNVREIKSVCHGLVSAARPGSSLDVPALGELYPEVAP